MEHKQLWEELAKKDAEYYIKSDLKDGETFDSSGKDDVERYIKEDIANKVVLEIGCGIGRLTQYISPKAKKVYAVDISREMLDKAKDRLKYTNIDFIESDGRSFEAVPDACVDYVFSFIVFQHMNANEVRSNLQEVMRVLKRGGTARIQIRGIKCAENEWFTGQHYSKEEIIALCKDIGFSNIKVEDAGTRYMWVILESLD
jgi:ubiquinone/menaquinone biosynthesis C-methylase UbiE